MLECRLIISQTGNLTDAPVEEQRQSVIDGLKQCANILNGTNITLVIEPLNTKIDHIGCYLSSSEEGAFIIDEVNNPHVKLLYDFYHQQITEGDIIRTSTGMLDKIRHFHAAGNPGRHELDVGEVDYVNVFKALRENHYKGFIGLEYFPLSHAEEGLRAANNRLIPGGD
jgi:hydroxypyruvate isomerase